MDYIRGSPHSGLLAVHCLLGACPVASYLLLGMLTTPVRQFVAAAVGSACNFWLVKNISGRTLVGLRWWTECCSGLEAVGSTTWLFETRQPPFEPNEGDAHVFWWSLYGLPAVWTVLLVSSVLAFSLFWSLCAGLCLCLHAINLAGYSKCDKDARRRRAVGISF